MAEGSGQKTEKATPKRRREARKDGQIPRSTDLVQWVVLVVATFALPSLLGGFLNRLRSDTRAAVAASAGGDLGTVGDPIAELVRSAVWGIAPFLVLGGLLTVVGLALQGGVTLTAKPLKPKLERISPVKGLKRVVSPESLVETAKALIRLAMLGGIGAILVPRMASRQLRPGLDAASGVAEAAGELLLLFRGLAVAGLLVGLADVAFQRWRNERKLRMSKDDIKQEMKSAEGSPEVRSRRRRAHQQLTQNQMLAGVADASVVLVNPVHVAVALEYSESLPAPRVTAKGRDDVAERIRHRAEAAGVPIVESRSLAWILHDTTRVGQSVPVELFRAVAVVLAFVLQTPKSRLTGSIRRVHVPASMLVGIDRTTGNKQMGTTQTGARRADGATPAGRR